MFLFRFNGINLLTEPIPTETPFHPSVQSLAYRRKLKCPAKYWRIIYSEIPPRRRCCAPARSRWWGRREEASAQKRRKTSCGYWIRIGESDAFFSPVRGGWRGCDALSGKNDIFIPVLGVPLCNCTSAATSFLSHSYAWVVFRIKKKSIMCFLKACRHNAACSRVLSLGLPIQKVLIQVMQVAK
jgi:hypothetical protein